MPIKIIADVKMPKEELIAKLDAWAQREPISDPKFAMEVFFDGRSWLVNGITFIKEFTKRMEEEENAK